MTLTDQVDFVITDMGIHRGPLAWKLGASSADHAAASRVFSVQVFDRRARSANLNATPTNRQIKPKPIQRDRSAFGGLQPVHNGPDATG